MTKLYLIRHAQAEGNRQGTVQGKIETGITDLGRAQLSALRRRFAAIPVDAVYSSDLFRAVETARAISEPKKLPIKTDRAFREVDFGRWEGRAWAELAITDTQQVENFNAHLERFQAPGGETAQMLLERFVPKMQEIVQENEGKTVALVSHGLALRVVLGALNGLTPGQIQTLHGANTAVSLVEWEGLHPSVIFQDDASHLGPVESDPIHGKEWWNT